MAGQAGVGVMETKHTPGPWHVGHLGSESSCQCRSVVDEGYAGGICTVHVDNGKLVGEGGNDAPSRDEAVANMHLIAAAPDLLEALRQMLVNSESDGKEYRDCHKKALSAISKAEGRS